jgi:NADP-dependent 3-hydroxy acid dehydrogenase YdfG
VAIAGRSLQTLDSAAKWIEDAVVRLQAEVRSIADLDRLFQTVADTLGNVDWLDKPGPQVAGRPMTDRKAGPVTWGVSIVSARAF